MKRRIEKKSICFVIPYSVLTKAGGAELQVFLISEEFIRRGWKVEMLTIKPDSRVSLEKDNVYFNGKIKYYFYKPSIFRSFEFITVLWLLLKTRSFYYYQRTDYALTGAVAFLCKLRRKCKMIYALAQDTDAKKRKYTDEFNQLNYQNKFKKLIRRIDLKLVDWFVEFGKGRADIIVVQTEIQRKHFRQNYGKNSVKIHNSYNPSIFKLTEHSEKENIILWVANYSPYKRAELFIQLAEELCLNDWKFIMIGDLPEFLQHKVKISKCENLMHLGKLTYEKTMQWFAKSRIFVNTSIVEGFPNTFMQAWLTGNLIASLLVDPDGIIQHYNYGFVYHDSFNDLKTGILELTKNYDQYSMVIKNSKKFIKSMFSVEKNVDKLISELLKLQH